MAAPGTPIVIGIDGSEHARAAADWAVDDAELDDAPVELVLVHDDPARTHHADSTVRQVAERYHGRTEVAAHAIQGHPIEELVRRSSDARRIVLGSRGHGGLADSPLGSVSAGVTAHAACPVVIVRGRRTANGPVVVGVDDSPGSRRALRFAYDFAARHDADLLVVQAWHEAGLLTLPLAPGKRDEIQQRCERSLVDQVIGWRDSYPTVTERHVAQHEHPVAALINAASDARLLVVGHRGRGGFSDLYLGSVAAGVLQHAPCPLAIVRAAREPG